MRHLCSALALVGIVGASPVLAGQGADLTRQHLYAGTLADGAAALAPMAEGGDAEARFGLGLMQFGLAAQDLLGALLGYGLVTPNPRYFSALARSGVTPETLSYEALRDRLQDFADGLDAARDTLVLAADAGGDWVVEVDLAKVRLDLDGDGTGSERESLAALASALAGEVMAGPIPLNVPNLVPEPAPAAPQGGVAAQVMAPPEAGIGFDRADGYWLAGYSQVLAAQLDFLLAHDFHDTLAAIGHRIFDSPVFPLSQREAAGSLFMDPGTDGQIADLVAALHTISWPVTDAPRLARIVNRLHAVTALSRQNWAAILEETDDRLELVPSPRQTALDPEAKVSDEMVAAWRETLDTVDRIIDGDLLLPHWRFQQGVSLNAFLTGARRTDVVMLLTGIDMIDFLRDGPKADAEAFRGANRVFGNDLWSYVFWFN